MKPKANSFSNVLLKVFTLSSRLAFSSKQVSCLRFPSVGCKVWTTTLSSFFDFRKFIWVNMINSKSLRYYNVKIKKKIYLVFQKVLIVMAYKFYTGKLLEFECLNFRQFFPTIQGKNPQTYTSATSISLYLSCGCAGRRQDSNWGLCLSSTHRFTYRARRHCAFL